MNKLTEPNARSRILPKRNKRRIPLYILRTSDAVKVVSDFPSRLEELFDMLEGRDRLMRDRAAATLARFASLHPSRLLRFVPRIKGALTDESAYVRWHIVHTTGILCDWFPKSLQSALADLMERLDDPNSIVRALAAKGLARSASRNPGIVEALFRNVGKEIPRTVRNASRRQD